MTTDARVMRRQVDLGWLLLDEVVEPGEGPDREELVKRPTSAGGGGASWRIVPVKVGPAEVTSYMLGYLKAGRSGQRG